MGLTLKSGCHINKKRSDYEPTTENSRKAR